MWNRWTFEVGALACAAALCSAPGEAPTVRYAWMVIADDEASYRAAAPAGDEWEAAAMVAAVAPRAEESVGLLELTSGDVLAGELVGVEGGEIVWRAARFGERRVALRDVAAVRLDGDQAGAGATLRNGDVLDGDVMLDKRGITVDELRVGWDRVASVRLCEASEFAGGLRVWLRDGGVVIARAVEARDGGMLVRRADGSAGLFRLDEIVALTRGTARVRVLDAPAETSGDVSFANGMLSARGAATAVWELERPVIGVFGVARTPEDSRAWGDALVSVWVGRESALTARTTPERTRAALGAAASAAAGEKVTLSAQPGTRGGANGVVEVGLVVIEVGP